MRFHARNLLRIELAVLFHDIECGFDGGVGTVAARIKFVAGARHHDVERIGPVRGGLGGIVIALAVEHIEEALLVFEGVRVCSEALARQQHGLQTVARTGTGVQRFGHGAEIRLGAATQ